MVNFATKTQAFTSQTAPFATFWHFMHTIYGYLFANTLH